MRCFSKGIVGSNRTQRELTFAGARGARLRWCAVSRQACWAGVSASVCVSVASAGSRQSMASVMKPLGIYLLASEEVYLLASELAFASEGEVASEVPGKKKPTRDSRNFYKRPRHA